MANGNGATNGPAVARADSMDHLDGGHDLGRREGDGIFSAVNDKYDPNSRWHRLRKNVVSTIFEAPKGTASIYADIPFTHNDWKKHRNAAYRHRMQPMLFLRVAGGFWWQLSYVVFVSILTGLWHAWWHHPKGLSSKLQVPFNMTTFALSLLLVFRTNSSYARWWEARMIWGAVVNLSRNFARQSLLWLPPSKARVAVRWMMAAPFLLKCHLRINADARGNVSHILLPEEVLWLTEWVHKPNAAAHVLAMCVREGKLDTIREQVLTELINAFIDCTGKCERIFKTPIPPAYTRHTSRYLMLYLTVVPLVLWGSTDWWTPVAAMVVTFLLLGTENIGVQIEEPFRVLPLDDMCRGIESALREMERHHNSVAPCIIKWQVDPEGLEPVASTDSDSTPPSPTQGTGYIPPPKAAQAAAVMLQRAMSKRGSFNISELHIPNMLHRKPSDEANDGSVSHGHGHGWAGFWGGGDGSRSKRESSSSHHVGGSGGGDGTTHLVSGGHSGEVHVNMADHHGAAHAGGSSSSRHSDAFPPRRSHPPYLPTVSSSGSEGEGEGGEDREGVADRRRRTGIVDVHGASTSSPSPRLPAASTPFAAHSQTRFASSSPQHSDGVPTHTSDDAGGGDGGAAAGEALPGSSGSKDEEKQALLAPEGGLHHRAAGTASSSRGGAGSAAV